MTANDLLSPEQLSEMQKAHDAYIAPREPWAEHKDLDETFRNQAAHYFPLLLAHAVALQAERDVEVGWLRPLLREAEQDRNNAIDFIHSCGYRRCDIAACNCLSWHGGHAEERLREIANELGDETQGVTILDAVRKRGEAVEQFRQRAIRAIQTRWLTGAETWEIVELLQRLSTTTEDGE